MRRSAFAVFVFSFHSLSHCFFAASLMALVRADFSGLWLYGWLVDGCSAAFFASSSARLFPSISTCPGIHIILIWRCGCWSLTEYVFGRGVRLSRDRTDRDFAGSVGPGPGDQDFNLGLGRSRSEALRMSVKPV